MERQPKIVFKDVNKVFHARRQDITALKDISFEVMPGEFVGLVGPSGCGKSTIIRILDDIIKPSSGEIYVDGYQYGPEVDKEVIRRMGFIFQHSNLLPWLTVRGNLEYPLKVLGLKGEKWDRLVEEMLRRGRMEAYADKYPVELSGGMAQRVGVYRAMVYQPEILLMDEPFGALDEVLRVKVNMELLDVWSELKQTILFITHNIREAVFLSDRVLVMSTNPGRIVQEVKIGLPRPRTPDVFTDEQFIKLVEEITGTIGTVKLEDIV